MFVLRAGPALKPFRVHKQLLSVVSAELRKHVYNSMKEGEEGSMDMPHVPEETMIRFLQFCYTGNYPERIKPEEVEKAATESAVTEGETVTVDGDAAAAAPAGANGDAAEDADAEAPAEVDEQAVAYERLEPNAQIYVFSEMYNIPLLKDIAYANIAAIISGTGYSTLDDATVRTAYINFFKYCFENLPEREDADKLLKFVARYAAWSLHKFRGDDEFYKFFVNSERMDFIKLLFNSLAECGQAPWETD